MRANEMAVAHMAHGSNVTYKSHPVNRAEPTWAAAARIASNSAWAVGSESSSVRLPARASTSPLRPSTSTAPTGTSPRSNAAWASIMASSI